MLDVRSRGGLTGQNRQAELLLTLACLFESFAELSAGTNNAMPNHRACGFSE